MVEDTSLEILKNINVAWPVIVVSVFVTIHTIANIYYDIFTKSDFEKCITYRGNERVLSGFALLILTLLITTLTAFEELIEIIREENLIIGIAVVIVTSLAVFLILISLIIIVYPILLATKILPAFEVLISFDDNKEEYWQINKVTRNNEVILKNGNNYLLLKDVKNLHGKVIRVRNKKKNKR